jgi:predicted metal-dependent HD superfamily phosphohydrolase
MPRIEQWREMWNGLGIVSPDETLFHELVGCYSEKHRRYHTLQHLDECFAWLLRIQPVADHPEEIMLALWFHDAIYDTQRQDNEEKSAEWARSAGQRLGLPSSVAERVYDLVMVTRHSAVPNGTDPKILVDIDLSILGAAAERFDEYEVQVREEYAWVPETLFRQKRKEILKEFLGRPSIFNTDDFFKSHESQARSNLQRSIKKLGN